MEQACDHLGESRGESGGISIHFVDGRQRLWYDNRVGLGNAIVVNLVSVASVLEAILAGTGHPKHSQNHVCFRMMNAHSYMTVLAILGLPDVIAMARNLFNDDPTDGETEKRLLD